MTKYTKNDVFNYIKDSISDPCYIGLHGLSATGDIANEYTNLTLKEKANNILDIGLINARGRTMSNTVRTYGDANKATREIITDINSYGYRQSDEQVIIMIAIPLFFEDSAGRKLFGGVKKRALPSEGDIVTEAECITDYVFCKNIPPEIILGYYSYDRKKPSISVEDFPNHFKNPTWEDYYDFTNSEIEVEFVQNPRYYSNLSQEEKDTFICDNFSSVTTCLDVNDPNIKNISSKIGPLLKYFENTFNQWETEYKNPIITESNKKSN